MFVYAEEGGYDTKTKIEHSMKIKPVPQSSLSPTHLYLHIHQIIAWMFSVQCRKDRNFVEAFTAKCLSVSHGNQYKGNNSRIHAYSHCWSSFP